MERHSVEDLPLSSKIIDRIRTVLESNYYLQEHHLTAIAEPAGSMAKDDRSEWLLEQCRAYAVAQRN